MRGAEHLWFRSVADVVYARSGIAIAREHRGLYERRIRALAKASGLRRLEEYYYRLRFHPLQVEIIQQLIETITTGETYFLREAHQLERFFEHIYPRLAAEAGRHGRPVRLWSAGCSTGEEAYTLAILANEHANADSGFEVIAGDINDQAVARARAGKYRESAFRAVPAGWREHYFRRDEDGHWTVRRTLRNHVQFVHMNLMSQNQLLVLPRPDAVFCRNVFIYFDRPAKRRATEHLYRSLQPGGYLMLGHAESLLSLEHEFTIDQIGGDFFYRKPEDSA